MDWFSLGRGSSSGQPSGPDKDRESEQMLHCLRFPLWKWMGWGIAAERERMYSDTNPGGPSTQYWKSCHSEQGSWRKEGGTEILESLGTHEKKE